MAYASVRKDLLVLRATQFPYSSFWWRSRHYNGIYKHILCTSVSIVGFHPQQSPRRSFSSVNFSTPSSCTLVRYSCHYDPSRFIKKEIKDLTLGNCSYISNILAVINTWCFFLSFIRSKKKELTKKSIIAKGFLASCHLLTLFISSHFVLPLSGG